MSGRLHRYLLDTEERPDAFKGPFGRLHRNWLFLSFILQGFFMDIFKQLVISYCLWFDHCWIREDSELKTDHPVKKQPLHKVFLFYPEGSRYKILTTISGVRLARPKGQLWAHPVVTGESCTRLRTSLGEGHPADSPHFRPSVWLPW
jgi:hypothetical protein